MSQKCTGCVHLLDHGWKETRCSQVCPTGAIKLYMASDEEMEKIATADELEVYKPELGTKPRVFYKNLYMWQKVFIAASVAYMDTDACAEGATITASLGRSIAGEGVANNYGEVVVDRLEPGAEYEVTITAKGYKAFTTIVKPDKSLNIGLVLLEKV